MKSIVKRFGILLLLGGVLFMTGCKSKQNTVKEVLKNKYNEEFIVYEVNTAAYGGDNYHAIAL